MPVMSFWCFYCKFWPFLHLFSSVSIVDFEQVNVSWVVLFQEVITKTYQHFFQANETRYMWHVLSPMQQNHLGLSFLLTRTNSHVNQGILDD